MASQFKQQLFNQFALVGKALSNANRLELLEFLAQGERSVDELAKVAGLTVANTSQHLQQLRQAGLLTSRKEGLKVFYRPASDDVLALFESLRMVAQQNLAEVERLVNTFLASKDNMEPIGMTELMQRVANGEVVVLDVRPELEYKAGHLPGAVQISLSDLEEKMQHLDPEKEVIAYCRGPHCVMSYDAVALLREKGFKARRMEDGFPEWRRAGKPVETS